MLTRLRVKGFKNLLDIDVRFGLFTCIAGPNGVGKSNLFDAILFLSDLASMKIIDAVKKARGTSGRISEFNNLFFQGALTHGDTIEIIAEMIVPSKVVDDYEREGEPQASLLEYSLTLKWKNKADASGDPIVIEKEELRAKSSTQMRKTFDGILDADVAQKFIFGPGNRTTPFIETIDIETPQPIIKLYGQGQNSGKPPTFVARKTPQTILSGVNSAITHPTQLAARREMQSWRMLQLEPTALRKHDNYRENPHISSIGEHLPATLKRLQTYDEVAASLNELLPDIDSVEVDDDKTREAYTLAVTMKNKNRYTAGSLSDGTLRFLALSILSTDPEATGLLCMEEPENGIHPLRIPEMMNLVRSLSYAPAADDKLGVAFRQVIINTHSPLVVAELPDDSLLLAEPLRHKGSTSIVFRPLTDTWRTKGEATLNSVTPVGRGHLLNYLRGALWSYINGQKDGAIVKSPGMAIKDRLASEAGQGELFR
jgi:predicted ATPase